MTIAKINEVKNAGIWHDYTAPADVHLASRTLVFGFNGTGKTTLSRILASLELGQISPKLPSTTKFKIQLSDGKTVTETLEQPPLGPNLLVFNTDFVERSFNWDESSSSGIVYISEKEAGAKKAFDECSEKLKQNKKTLPSLNTGIKATEKSIREFKTRVAREIREMTPTSIYTQSYDARKIQGHYTKSSFGKNLSISNEALSHNQEILSRRKPLDIIDFSFNLPSGLESWLKESQRLLERSSSDLAVDALADYQDALPWMKHGLDYHEDHELEKCLLCDNLFPKQRRDFLKTIFTDAWKKVADDLKNAAVAGEDHLERLTLFYGNIPNPEKLSAEFRTEYETGYKNLRTQTEKTGEAVKYLIFKLKEKIDSTLNTLGHSSPTLGEDIKDIISDFGNQASTLENLAKSHNKKSEDFEKEQKSALGILEGHVLSANQATWDKLHSDLSEQKANLAKTEEDIQKLDRQFESLRNELQDHGVAAERLNALLFSYLGHNNIYLTAEEAGGYKISRAGGEPALHLSEGEKTAIAFCFFLTTLEAEDKKLQDLTLIIDDPVSSLDTSARTHAFSLLFRQTKKCAQLVLLTHNTSFMNMVKREFQNLEHREPNTISLLSLDCRSSPDGSLRSTALTKMHPLMVKHQSEYHYLFQLVRTAAVKDETDYLYLLPNATRKLLDIFTNFCSPGQPNFAAALMEHHETVNGKIDLKALERLIQIESHGTIEGFGTLPDLTLQDAIGAAKAAIGFIESVAKDHYRKMCRACGSVD